MHILCIYQHYANFDCANSGRLFTFLSHLAPEHRITLISGKHWYDQRLTRLYPWVPINVEWLPVDLPYSNKMSAAERLRAYSQFPLEALRLGRRLNVDAIYAISTPLTTGWAARKIARKLDVPWVFEIRDLWPDFPVQMGAVKNKYLRKRLYRMEKELYHDSDRVLTVSPDMSAHVTAHGVDSSKVETLLQGTNLDLAEQAMSSETPEEFRFGDRKVVLYAGTFGRANAIPEMLSVAETLRDRDDLVFVFTGEGFYEDAITAVATRSANVVLVPRVPRHRILKLFRGATISLVPFGNLPVLATNSPAKFFDSLAVGTPVIVTNPGWTRKFVEEHRCGFFAPASDTGKIADFILTYADSTDKEAMSQRCRQIAREQFDRQSMAERLEEIFENLVAGNARAGTKR